MKSSRGEIKICEVLDNAGLQYQEEYTFKDLVTTKGYPLRFDFAIFDDEGELDFLIEYQGTQHYQPRDRFGGVTGFNKQKYNDTRKRVYCNKNHLKLVAIPHWDEPLIDYDYIMRAAGY